ncbi:hypothetical protein BDZ91DRAFT_511561 [Kalaharituber pfeilii]|nr:hypothetical protein BDZ91DRAFT_511561 [Kalaharituber pfeilii]
MQSRWRLSAKVASIQLYSFTVDFLLMRLLKLSFLLGLYFSQFFFFARLLFFFQFEVIVCSSYISLYSSIYT